jgi:hypothetical protein
MVEFNKKRIIESSTNGILGYHPAKLPLEVLWQDVNMQKLLFY